MIGIACRVNALARTIGEPLTTSAPAIQAAARFTDGATTAAIAGVALEVDAAPGAATLAGGTGVSARAAMGIGPEISVPMGLMRR